MLVTFEDITMSSEPNSDSREGLTNMGGIQFVTICKHTTKFYARDI